MINLVELTRIYVDTKDYNTIKTQPLSINPAMVTSIRPSNRLNPGDTTPPAHRSTITLVGGVVFDLADKYSVVVTALSNN